MAEYRVVFGGVLDAKDRAEAWRLAQAWIEGRDVPGIQLDSRPLRISKMEEGLGLTID